MRAFRTIIRQRLAESVLEQMFALVLGLRKRNGVWHGKTVANATTTLEAKAAMKSFVRRDSGKDWNQFLRCLRRFSTGKAF